MTKKYLYLAFISLFAVYTAKAQFNSSFGQRKLGSPLGGLKNGFGGLHGFGNSMGNFSIGSPSGMNSNNASSTNKSSVSSSFSTIHSMGSSYSSIGQSTESISRKNSEYSSVGSMGNSSAVTSSTLKNIAQMRSYPGIGKSKTISSLKGGTKYSFPGIHNLRWDIDKMKKQSQSGGTGNSK